MSPEATDKPNGQKLQALLAAAGADRPEDPDQNIEAFDHDWRKPRYLDSASIAELRALAEGIASSVAAGFAEVYQGGFKVVAESISQHFAGEFSHCDPEQTGGDYYLPFTVEPPAAQTEAPAQLQLSGIVGAPAETAIAWIRQSLAETTAQDEQPKGLSQLERSLLYDVMSIFATCLADCCGRRQCQPGTIVQGQFPSEWDDTTELCKITFDVGPDGSEQSSRAYILLPCAKLGQLIRTAAHQSEALSPADISKALRGHLRNMDIALTVTLGSATLTFGQLMDLSVGDVLLLDKKVNDHIEVAAEGIEFFKARPAKCDGAYAVVITQLACRYTANS